MTRLVQLLGTMVALVALFWASPASAHAAPRSVVFLDFRAHDVAAELHIPIAELEVAWHRPLRPELDRIVEEERAPLRAYVAQYLHAEAPDKTPWTVTVGEVSYRIDDDVPFVDVRTFLVPPAGASAQTFVLDYDVVTHDVVSHNALVTVRSDFSNGVVTGQPMVLGVIRYLRKTLLVDRAGGGDFRGFRGVFHLGIQHISEGTDHLLFLLALLLPAPLLVSRRAPGAGSARWSGYAGFGNAVSRVLRVVTAFTVGHSVTLLLGAFGVLRLPSAPIEVLIALSILVSAVHATKPLVAPGREVWIAGGFGFVHGMAFASALTELNLDPYRLALSVFGFNLGIESMQLFVVALAFPWLMLLAKTPIYSFVRLTGAAFAACAAVAWIGERAFHTRNPMNAVLAPLAAHPGAVVGALAAIALASRVGSRLGKTVAQPSGAVP